MIPLYTPQQVRGMDEATIAGGTPSLVLMERAAGHLARAVLSGAPRRYGLRVLLLCGKGNNGGDGLAAARLLRSAGADVRVHLAQGETGLSGDAEVQLSAWTSAGGRLVATPDLDWPDVVVDCLLGTGAAGTPREPLAGLITAVNDHTGFCVVACDLPSGVDADTGAVAGVAIRADRTVTLGAHKRGLWLAPARGYCGDLAVADIGIAGAGAERPAAQVLEAADVARLLPEPHPDSDKRTRGVVVALAGSAGMSGAAVLVARGAMAGGAGLVTVATAQQAQPVVATALPEALTVGLDRDDPDAAYEQLCGRLEGADALAVGPGLGHDPQTVALVRRIVETVDLPIVLDADGLNAFRGEGDLLAKHATPLLVTTPHAREFARLLGSDGGQWDDRARMVPERSSDWNAVVVAKGPGSLIAAPDGRAWINPTGSAALATGGTGDVLTGITAAAIAQDADPERVAAAVWVHGRAGEVAAARSTTRSVTAGDVADAVPHVFRELSA